MFEAMEAYILPHDPVANKKANPNKNEKQSVSDAIIASMVGGRNQNDLDLYFYDFKECKTLSVEGETALK